MDEDLMNMLLAYGYEEVGHVMEEGEIVKATYRNEEGQAVDLYHKKYAVK